MSAFDKYIDQLVAGEEVEYGFPKNESSWEELFEFGKLRINEIVILKRVVVEFKGKCYRHGVLFKSGMGFDSCPACYFEGELGKLKSELEKNSKLDA